MAFLPEPVTLNRLAIPLCVFALGIFPPSLRKIEAETVLEKCLGLPASHSDFSEIAVTTGEFETHWGQCRVVSVGCVVVCGWLPFVALRQRWACLVSLGRAKCRVQRRGGLF